MREVVMKTAKKTVRASPKNLAVAALKAEEPNALLYEKDFYKWTRMQVSFLKEQDFSSLDLDNLIEEIESLGKSERDKLESHLTILLMHMLKIHYQPGKHTKSWDLSIKNSRHKAKKVLKENPSLKPKLKSLVKEAYFSARLEAAIETKLDEKIFPKECQWTLEEILNPSTD